jgi:hypothetical protein
MAKIDRMTGKDWADAHEKGMKGALDDIREGVGAVSESPGKKAVARADVWKDKVSSDETFKVWKKKTDYPLEYWKTLMEKKGIKNITTGLEATRDKRAQKGENLLKAVKEVRSVVGTEKPKDIDEAKAKVAKFIEEMHKRKGTI